jgi:hypothetical protein
MNYTDGFILYFIHINKSSIYNISEDLKKKFFTTFFNIWMREFPFFLSSQKQMTLFGNIGDKKTLSRYVIATHNKLKR